MARAAKGTLLQVGNTATTIVYTTVGEVRDITGPAYSLETVETTSHSSTGDYEEIVPTILRTGDVAFDVNLDPKDATHLSTAAGGSTDGLFHLFENKVNRTMQVVVPSSTGTSTITFDAYVTGFSLSHPVLGEQLASVTIKPTGAPTWSTTA